MWRRSKLTEESILAMHRARAQGGFEALKAVTAFCCSGCGLCISICPAGSIAFDDMSKKPVQMVQVVWEELSSHYLGVGTDAFVVMPNHVHGIITLVGAVPPCLP